MEGCEAEAGRRVAADMEPESRDGHLRRVMCQGIGSSFCSQQGSHCEFLGEQNFRNIKGGGKPHKKLEVGRPV